MLNRAPPPAARVNSVEAKKTLSAELSDLDVLNLNELSDVFDDDAATHSTQVSESFNDASSAATHHENHLQRLVEDTLAGMRKNTSRRGKRKNAVHFFVSSRPAIQASIAQDYTQALFDRHVVAADEIEVHLHAATRLVGNYVELQDYLLEMNDLLPDNLAQEGYKTPQDHVFGFIERHLLSHKAMHYDEATFNNLTPGQAAQIMCWIDAVLLAHMHEHCPKTNFSPAWQTDLDQMWDHYLEVGVRQQLRLLFRNSISDGNFHSEDDLRQNAQNEMVTGHPEQIAFIVDSQLNAAREHLPSTGYLEAVLVECNREISAMVSQLRRRLESDWRTLGTARFCALINDASRLSEMMEERNEQYFVHDDNDYNNNNNSNRELGEAVTRDLTELSLHATRVLCERMVHDLREPEAILSGIGGPEWARDDQGTAIRRTIATFRDYFADLQVWLPADYYFPKILRCCFDLTLQTYVESFYSNTMATGIRDAAVVAENLSQDFLNLTIFFNGSVYEKYAGKAGSLSTAEVNERLQVIQSMSRIVNPRIPPSDLEDDACKVLAHTQHGEEEEDSDDTTHKSPVVLHLAGLRQRQHDTQRSSVEWLRVIAHATEQQASQQREAAAHRRKTTSVMIIRLPDLRHSRCVRQFRTGGGAPRPQDFAYRTIPRAQRAVQNLLQQTTAGEPQRKLRNFIAHKKANLHF